MLKNRSNESQLIFAQINRNHFLLTQVKSNCDSLLLLLSTHSTLKLSSTQEVARANIIKHCICGGKQGTDRTYAHPLLARLLA